MPEISQERMHKYVEATEKCFERVGGGRLAMNVECLRPLAKQFPDETVRYVEMYCAMAYSQPGFLKIPYILALLYNQEHENHTLLDLVWKTADETGGAATLRQISIAESAEAAAAEETPERDGARQWWNETGSEDSTCDVCDALLRRGDGYLVANAGKTDELLCRGCFDRRHAAEMKL